MIRKADFHSQKDKSDFSELILTSAPYFQFLFGNEIKEILKRMFAKRKNLFSYEHVYFIEFNNENAGMILSYDWIEKRRENLRTGYLFFRYAGFNMIWSFSTLLEFNEKVGKIPENSFYVSNLAVYPEYRGKGFGKKLMKFIELKNAKKGIKRAVLDVERDNVLAVKFYLRMGYKISKESSISLFGKKELHFLRMSKEIESVN